MVLPSAHDALGIAGFTFADLHKPARLHALYELFCDEVRRTEPDLWAEWSLHRLTPTALGPVARGNLMVAMAPHVSRFITRLFGVGPDAAAMIAGTEAYDDLFRFKSDFVRKRAVPLLKGASRPEASAADHDRVAQMIGPAEDGASTIPATPASELAIARAGCALLDREEAARVGGDAQEKETVAADIDALRRWCAAHLHDPRYRDWVIFRFPETLDPIHLVHVQRPDSALPEAMIGPDAKLRRRHGFALTDERFTPREILSEIHYCVLCHERDKDSCSKGIRDKAGVVATNALGIAAARLSARREDLRDARAAEARRCHRRARHRHRRQSDVPRHRPPDLQRLHEGAASFRSRSRSTFRRSRRACSPTSSTCRGASRSTAC